MESTTKSKKTLSELQSLKVPPHSTEAEQSVLGGLMLNAEAWDKVGESLSKKDFYRPEHRLIFDAIQTLIHQRKAVDVLTVSDFLKAQQELDRAGGEAYLFELAQNTPSIANIGSYAEIVKERSILRQLLQASQEIAESAYQPGAQTIVELLDQAEQRIFAIAEQDVVKTGPVDIKHIAQQTVAKVYERYQSPQSVTGLKTGFIDLDEMTSGLQPADLIIIAGRPSMGKTAFGMNIAETVAIRSGKSALVFSMEMPSEAIVLRTLSSLGRVEQGKIRSGNLTDVDWSRVQSSVNILSEAKMLIDDTPGLSPAEIRARARRAAREQGDLGLILVDYLQLMQVPGSKENRTSEISEISRSLKSLARELNVPLIALSQLNRSLEQRSDRRPIMSDLRESGSIEQDADLILFIYRDEVYNENSPDKNVAEIIIAKHRNGPIGKVKLKSNLMFSRFENFADNVVDFR